MNKKLKYAVVILIAAIVLFAGEVLLFKVIYADTLYLVKVSEQEIGERERSEIERIHRETIRSHYPGARKLILLTDLLVRMHQDAEASELMAMLVERYPNDLGLRLRLADTLAKLNRPQEAETEYTELLRRMDERRESKATRRKMLLAAARNSIRAGQLDLSAERFERLLGLFPGDLQLRDEYAGVLILAGRLGEAQEQYEMLVEAAPDNLNYRIALADVAIQHEDYEEAAIQLEHVLSQRPDDNALRRKLAAVCSWGGDYERSIAHYEVLFEEEPADPDLLREYLSVLQAANETEKFFKYAERFIELVPEDLEIRYQLADIHSAEGNFDAAEEACREILSQVPGDERAERKLADILTWKENYLAATALYEKLFESNKDDIELRTRLAQLSLWQNDYDRSLEHFQAVLDDDIDRQELWRGYAEAASGVEAVGEGQKKTANRIYERIIEMPAEPDKPAADTILLARLASVLRRLKESEKSVVLLEKALALAPDDRSIRLQLADTLHELGQFEKAEEHYRALLEALPDKE